MGKSKTTTSSKADPWIPTQETFDQFRRSGQTLMSAPFLQGLQQAGGTLGQAAGASGINPAVQQALADQMRSGVQVDPRFNKVTGLNAPGITSGMQQATGRAINADLDPRFSQGIARATGGGLDPIFARATQQAQAPQYARGFQNTVQEMTDPNARSEAFGQVRRNVADQVMQDVNATFGSSGMTGSSLHQQNLSRGLASGMADVENQAFQQMRDRALQAAQVGQQDLQQQRQFGMGAAQARQGAQDVWAGRQLQGAGMVQDAQSAQRAQALQAAGMQQSALTGQFGQNLQAAGMRQDAFGADQARAFAAANALQGMQQQRFGNLMGLSSQQAGLGQQYQSAYQNAVQGLMGAATGGASQTQTQSQSPGLMGVLGAGLQVASLFSDERLKTDRKRVGELDDGTPVYTYRYKDGVAPEFDGKTLMGVMAQQVKKKKAVEKDPSGFKRVNYGAL